MRWPRFLVALVTSVAGVLIGGAASASLVLALDLPSMVTRADYVVMADVVAVTAAWDARHERILTTIEVRVVETWKRPSTSAAPAVHFTIVQRGGAVDDTSMTVYGMPHFSPGERAVLFLQGRPDLGSVVGMAQGKRVVRRDASTGRWVVHAPDRAGAVFVRTTPASGSSPVFDLKARPLDELRAEIKALTATSSRAQ